MIIGSIVLSKGNLSSHDVSSSFFVVYFKLSTETWNILVQQKGKKRICNAFSSLLKMSLRSEFISGRLYSGRPGAAQNSLRSSLEQRACALFSLQRFYLTWQPPSAHCRPPHVDSAIRADPRGCWGSLKGFVATENVSWIYESFFHWCEIISWRGGSQLIQANGSHLNLSSALHLRLSLWSSTGKTEIWGQIYGDFRKRPFSRLQCGNAEASDQLTTVKILRETSSVNQHTHPWRNLSTSRHT